MASKKKKMEDDIKKKLKKGRRPKKMKWKMTSIKNGRQTNQPKSA